MNLHDFLLQRTSISLPRFECQIIISTYKGKWLTKKETVLTLLIQGHSHTTHTWTRATVSMLLYANIWASFLFSTTGEKGVLEKKNLTFKWDSEALQSHKKLKKNKKKQNKRLSLSFWLIEVWKVRAFTRLITWLISEIVEVEEIQKY